MIIKKSVTRLRINFLQPVHTPSTSIWEVVTRETYLILFLFSYKVLTVQTLSTNLFLTRVGPAEKNINLHLLPVNKNALQVSLTC